MHRMVWWVIVLLLQTSCGKVSATERPEEESDSESYEQPHYWSALLEEWATK